MSNAAQAYARTSHTTSSPREIEAQALLKAARQLQEVQTNWAGPSKDMDNALLFNRRLWSIFLSAAQGDDNPQPLEVRQVLVTTSRRGALRGMHYHLRQADLCYVPASMGQAPGIGGRFTDIFTLANFSIAVVMALNWVVKALSCCRCWTELALPASLSS